MALAKPIQPPETFGEHGKVVRTSSTEERRCPIHFESEVPEGVGFFERVRGF